MEGVKIFLVFWCFFCSAQGCSQYFRYHTDNFGSTFAQISVPVSKPEQKLVLDVFMSVPAYLDTKNVATIKLLNKNTYEDMIHHKNLIYEIYPQTFHTLPSINGIKMNGKMLCKIPPDKDTVMIKLNHFQEVKEITPSTSALISQRFQPKRDAQKMQCGRRSEDAVTSLILGGQDSRRAAFPWLAAYYWHNNFMCGGSLISDKLVVTSAHCIHDYCEKYAKRPRDSFFYLGKHNLNDLLETGYVKSNVDRFILHDSWRPQERGVNGDIALAVLSTRVRFSQYITPICLWRETRNYKDLVGKNGVVSGWGVDNIHRSTAASIPQFLIMPVVDEGECIGSNEFFRSYVTDRVFCAGDRVGKVPCTGDSGGGFVTKKDNVYYLRGIIQGGIWKEHTQCSLRDFYLFTDVAYYSDWLLKFIQNFA